MPQRPPEVKLKHVEACGYDLATVVVAIVQGLDLAYPNGYYIFAEALARSLPLGRFGAECPA